MTFVHSHVLHKGSLQNNQLTYRNENPAFTAIHELYQLLLVVQLHLQVRSGTLVGVAEKTQLWLARRAPVRTLGLHVCNCTCRNYLCKILL